MPHATLLIDIPASQAKNRPEWQTLRDDILNAEPCGTGFLRLSENAVSIELSTRLSLFSKIIHLCTQYNLTYSVLITDSPQGWLTQRGES